MRKIYLSHPIRGRKGKDATFADMENNNKITITKAKQLRQAICDDNIYIYVPAEHDQFVLIAYKRKLLTEKDILDIDCEIVDDCDLLLVYNWEGYISRGMQREIDCANDNGISIFTFNDETKIRDIVYEIDSLIRE